jgi:hypothetical protein
MRVPGGTRKAWFLGTELPPRMRRLAGSLLKESSAFVRVSLLVSLAISTGVVPPTSTGSAAFSTGGAAIKATTLTGWQVASFRSGVAALVIWAFVPAARRGWSARTWLVAIGYAMTMIAFVVANKLTTAANAIFLQSAVPLYILLLGPLGRVAPLTDPARLEVQPDRVTIVSARRTQTLGEWARDVPSSIPIDELAIINQLPGPSATVEAGTLLKRVAPRS